MRSRREKVFGPGRSVPLDRNAKARIMAYARAWGARHRQSGQHRGPITRAFLEVLEALLWDFHNSRDGRCFPSYEAIATKAECARSTVAEALKVLELAAVLTWAHCIARIQVRERDLFGVTTTWDVPHKKPLALRGRLRQTPPVTDPSLVGAVTVSRGRLDTAARRTTGYCGAGVIHPKGTAQV
jgi:hypothetical protein